MATDDATYKRRTEVYGTKCLVTLNPQVNPKPYPSATSSPGVPFVMRWKNRDPSPTKRIAASENEIDPRRALVAHLFTGAQGTGYFPDIFKNGDFFSPFSKKYSSYSNRFRASLENVVSLEAAFLDIT